WRTLDTSSCIDCGQSARDLSSLMVSWLSSRKLQGCDGCALNGQTGFIVRQPGTVAGNILRQWRYLLGFGRREDLSVEEGIQAGVRVGFQVLPEAGKHRNSTRTTVAGGLRNAHRGI